MIVITIISLYTSRIVLKLLGLEDFGIFNVIAGIVEFATIFTGTMTSATQRFLSYELGKNDLRAFSLTFCSLFNIFILFCFILLIISIIIGPWLICDILDIPESRIDAALWVFICSILSFSLSTLAIPYMSAIIAYERMNIYTYISIAEALCKLAVILPLFYYDGDQLIAYAIAILAVRLMLNVGIGIYCKTRIAGCNYHLVWDQHHFKQLAAYSGWTLIGATSYVMTTQGHSILLNLFFGPIVNAAKGISDRIKNYALMFSQNILVAISPQLIKSYAAKKIEYSKQLVIVSSKLSFMLMLLIFFPIFMEMQTIIDLWLGEENNTHEAIVFSQNCLIFVLISTIEAPLTKVVQANGNIKSYEIIVGSITLLFIPLSYLLLKNGNSANSTFIILNLLYATILLYRIYRVKKLISISYKQYMHCVLVPIILVCSSLTIIAVLLTNSSFIYNAFILRFSIWGIITLIIILLLGLSSAERVFIYRLIRHVHI